MTRQLSARCPNHLVKLQDSGTRGIGICPISGWHFAYSSDDDEGEDEIRIDRNGNPIRIPKVRPVKGPDGTKP